MLMTVHNVSVCVERISGLWYGNNAEYKQTCHVTVNDPKNILKSALYILYLWIGTQLDTTTSNGSALATIATMQTYSLNSLGLQQSSQLLATGLPLCDAHESYHKII